MKKWVKVVLIVGIVAVLAAAAFFLFLAKPQPVTVASLGLDTAQVTRGDLAVTVHGTGTLEVDVTQDVYARVNGRVQVVHKEDGDAVEAGELIAVLESDTLDEDLRTLSDDLYVRELELSSTRLGRTVSSIRAPIGGRVKLLNAKKDDEMTTVQKQYGALAVISSDGRMRVSVPAPEGYVAPEDAQSLKVRIGDNVETGSLLAADAQELTVLIPNDIYDPGALATVSSAEGVELGTGTLAINKPVVVTGVSGKIKNVDVKENDKVNTQDRLFTLDDDTLSADAEKKLIERDQLQRKVDDTREKISRLEIRAPIDGIVANFTLREGAAVQDGQQIATVIQTDRAKVRLSVDELDVAAVLPAQPAKIKVDAIPGKVYETTVERVLPVGTRANDITNYDVLLYLAAQDNMLPYMSVSGDITVATAEGTLLIPTAALQSVGEEKYVLIAPSDADLVNYNASRRTSGFGMMASMGGKTYDVSAIEAIAPHLMRRVEVGLVSGEYAQVVSGLQEGEQVVLPRTGNNPFSAMMRSNGGQGGGM